MISKKYLNAHLSNGDKIIDFIKNSKPIWYIQLIDEIILNHDKEKNLVNYYFSSDYLVMFLKIKTTDEIKQHRININQIGLISLSDSGERLALSINSKIINFFPNQFKDLESYSQFKNDLEDFINEEKVLKKSFLEISQ